GECRAFSGSHFKVAGDSTGVASIGKFQIFLSRDNCFVLNLGFVLKDAKGRHVVLDLLKAGQHGLAIVGDGLIVGSDGLVRGGPAPSYVEDRKQSRWTSRPQNAG